MTETVSRPDRTGVLLTAGLAAAALFPLGSFAQAFTRAGFDLRRHALSALTLGDLGRLQTANFIATGALAIVFAAGARRATRGPGRAGRAAVAGPLLIGLYGGAMIGGGLFHPDPALGWPAGAPDGLPAHLSPSSALHTAFGAVAFLSMIAAAPVFARRFAPAHRGWAALCATAGAGLFLLTVPPWGDGSASLRFAAAAVLASGGLGAIAWRLRADHRRAAAAQPLPAAG